VEETKMEIGAALSDCSYSFLALHVEKSKSRDDISAFEVERFLLDVNIIQLRSALIFACRWQQGGAIPVSTEFEEELVAILDCSVHADDGKQD